ncbi:branched-chain amino acid ABC transporter permease [Georgenia sp. 10Sc9-8]|uniref:Branched-chain amino acid ABC transporter permease n=1 Tax=Georgenia halotolerans TaxID=3028317 RepID=A0ABT5U3B4_9MICO|nr:branched-chain amino acid ABC transporter permease [Georgenia halotolerans]
MQYLIYGLISGSILATAAVGFALIRQTEGFLNIAHGQFLLLGGTFGYLAVTSLGLPIWIATVVAALTVGLVGVLAAVLVMHPLKGRGPLTLLFTSVGLSYVIQGLVVGLYGTGVNTFPVSFGDQITLGSVRITWGEIAIIAVAAVSIVSLHLFLTRTPVGTSIRAVSSNPQLAKVRGIRTEETSLTVWFIASSLAGLAGVLLGLMGAVHSEMGWSNILLILAATVLGGLGRIYGVVVAALLLGILMDMSSLVIPTSYRLVVAFGALILVLIVRPQGLFTLQRRKQVA